MAMRKTEEGRGRKTFQIIAINFDALVIVLIWVYRNITSYSKHFLFRRQRTGPTGTRDQPTLIDKCVFCLGGEENIILSTTNQGENIATIVDMKGTNQSKCN